MKQLSGFTLLEVLIALTVFAILATITGSAMHNAFETQAHLNTKADQLNRLQLALAIVKRDTDQVINRAVRGNELHLFPPFLGQTQYVEFTTSGMLNPESQAQRSALQRVAYLCKNGQLIRRHWPVLDAPKRNQYVDRILLSNLQRCQFAYLAQNRQILPMWQGYALQQNQNLAHLPMAIRLSFALNQQSDTHLLFVLPIGVYGE